MGIQEIFSLIKYLLLKKVIIRLETGKKMNKNEVKKLELNEVIAYECHVKGLTMDKSCNVNHPGTFLGVAERLDYIKNLGVNQLIFLPVYDFDESLCEVYGVPKGFHESLEFVSDMKNYWGYTTGDYFCTKKSYGIKNSDEEFQYLVKEAHKSGIEIIVSIYFDPDVNTELMLKVLKYWLDNFLVDGFFVNVNSYYLKMISDCSYLSAVKLYSYDIDSNLNYTNPGRIAVYDYNFRNTLRRLLKGEEGAFAEYYNLLKYDGKIKRIISVTSHNGFTLRDLYSYIKKHNEANGEYNRDGDDINYSDNFGIEGNTDDKTVLNSRLNAMKNAVLMLLLSKGVPMLLAGDESGNTQDGNNNAYCQDNEMGWVLSNDYYRENLTPFIKMAVDLRKESKVFTDSELLVPDRVNKNSIPGLSIHTGEAWECNMDCFTKSAGIFYSTDDSFLYIAANFDKYERNLSIPHLPKGLKWVMIAGTGAQNHVGSDEIIHEHKIHLIGNSVRVYIGKK